MLCCDLCCVCFSKNLQISGDKFTDKSKQAFVGTSLLNPCVFKSFRNFDWDDF